MLGARRSPVTPSADTCVATALCPASAACTGAWPRAAALAGTGLALGPVGVGGRVSGAPWRSRLSLAGRVASGSAVCLYRTLYGVSPHVCLKTTATRDRIFESRFVVGTSRQGRGRRAAPVPPLAGQGRGGRSSCRRWAAGVWSTATRLNTSNLTIPLSETESLIHEPPWFSPG